jgi:hypothetical protein
MSNEEMNHLIIIEARTLAASDTPDVHTALRRFREQRNTPSPAVTPMKRRWPVVTAITAAAAAVLIAISLILLLRPTASNKTSNNLTTLVASSPLTQTLPDGSTIQLTANAKIIYPKNFPTDRHIRLSGDAFFTVAHDAANPFRVEVNNLTITVLGTAFGITTLENKTVIVVKEGLIEVTRQELRVKVAAHQKLSVPHDTGTWQTVPDTLGAPVAIPSPASAQSTAPPQKAASHRSPDTTQPAPAKADTLQLVGDKIDHCLIMRAILDDIVKAGIVPNRDAIIFAALTPDGLIVNDVHQPDSLYQKLKEKYHDAAGNGYYYGTLHNITGRGYFFGKTDLDNCRNPARKLKEPAPAKTQPPKAKMRAV